MIEFLWPYMMFFLPLPFIIRWIIFYKDNKIFGHKLKIPFFSELQKLGIKEEKFYNPSYIRMLLLMIVWILLVMASARPIRIADSWSIDVEGRDLMIAIDASGSMDRPETLDGVKMTRLDVVKSITSELIKARKGDRVGLIIFGSKAFLYSPLSFDLNLVNNFLDEVYAGMAGPQTAIGDAMVLSVKYLHNRPTENKVLLLMTDGVNQGGKFTPEQGLELITKAGIKVYPIGIGFSDADGKDPIKKTEIDLDEPLLYEIAEKSGGEPFRVNSADDLKVVFNHIAQLEKIDESLIRQSVDEIYYVYIMWAIGVIFLIFLLQIYMIQKARTESEKGEE